MTLLILGTLLGKQGQQVAAAKTVLTSASAQSNVVSATSRSPDGKCC